MPLFTIINVHFTEHCAGNSAFCNSDATSAMNPTAAGLSMTLGVLSNIIALFILSKAYARLRRRSKATFLLFASSLVATDFAGHIIPGALVLHLYSNGVSQERKDSDACCLLLGGSMVFFGLCPLFLGCAMAAERCLGVTRPLLHARLVSTTRTKMAVVTIWLVALVVALLPISNLGEYTYQYPGTWCFIRVLRSSKATDVVFVLLFSVLGLTSLAMSLVCNTISGITIVWRRIGCGIFSKQDPYRFLMVMGVRLASYNQILDPWVYILLRRAVLRKIYRLTTGRTHIRGSTFRRWEISSFQNSEKNTVKRI
uniref:Thromboxane A2 receptor n=1 Tax=Astyanax mexicanus TaxID=7994 RepID=A0A3B1IDP2_ASTMX